MSGYLANLVARAAGPPLAAVAPRLAPLFPVGRPRQTDELPSADARAAVSPADLHPDDPSGQRRVWVRSDDEGGVGRRTSTGPAGAPKASATTNPARATHETETQAAVPLGAGAPARVESTERRPSNTDARSAGVERLSAVDTRIEVRVEPSPSPGPPPTRQGSLSPAQPVAVARPRSFATPLPARPGAAAPTRERPPTIEVQIGRVEIRRPSPSQPFQWPVAAAEPQTFTGFGELAAARRYVDRGWS